MTISAIAAQSSAVGYLTELGYDTKRVDVEECILKSGEWTIELKAWTRLKEILDPGALHIVEVKVGASAGEVRQFRLVRRIGLWERLTGG